MEMRVWLRAGISVFCTKNRLLARVVLPCDCFFSKMVHGPQFWCDASLHDNSVYTEDFDDLNDGLRSSPLNTIANVIRFAE